MLEGDSEDDALYIEGALLCSVVKVLDEHAQQGLDAPYLVLLNPANFALLSWDEIYGMPVLADDRVPPMRCRLVCGAEGWAGEYEGEPVWWIDGIPHRVLSDVDEDQAAA
ncbi:hypothetical protein GKE82_25815 [Conexibacter sp. W3-3-2]|uniref:hypothetical protein n=1 Tax=Conexibacter sp. W3-3-2 TaxID=2675227 RepID=UPI0012B6D991|nr:hypothetical protein [Conexibacter sp. W3-3-2]MTD47624.1 hypothetical protein [Conexibacter sp. W3-3-2]